MKVCELNMCDSLKLSTKKLNPLSSNPTISSIPKNTDLLALNHHLATSTVNEHNMKDNNEQTVTSSRWNPTPEQLLALEEMYRRGMRTPTADQIQQIASRLRWFGKIEGKNVFYWFQNHKARERQKRRREMESNSDHQQQHDVERIEKKDLGLKRTGNEGKQTKNWLPCSNCSGNSEEFVLMQRATPTPTAKTESGTDGKTQFEERELQQTKDRVQKHATWQTVELSFFPSAHLIKSKTTNTNPFDIQTSTDLEDPIEENQTLELFPLHGKGKSNTGVFDKITELPIRPPNQFFEFLPLKN